MSLWGETMGKVEYELVSRHQNPKTEKELIENREEALLLICNVVRFNKMNIKNLTMYTKKVRGYAKNGYSITIEYDTIK